jgi:LAGLIDADG-like domain
MDWTISSESHIFSEVKTLLDDLAYSFGFFLGDGSFGISKRERDGNTYFESFIVFADSDADTVARVNQELTKIFGRSYSVLERDTPKGTRMYQLVIRRDDVVNMFGLLTAFRMRIPQYYFGAERVIKIEFLRGCLDTDGYISERDFGSYKRWSVGFANTNLSLVQGVAAIMQSLGVQVGKIGESRKGEYRSCYRISPNIKSFLEAGLGFYSARKAQKLQNYMNYVAGSETLYTAPVTSGEDKVQSVVKTAE